MQKTGFPVRRFLAIIVIVGSVTVATPVQGQQVVATVQLPGSPPAESLALDVSDEILFVGAGTATTGSIYGIYVPNASIIGDIMLPGPGEPSSIAYSPGTGLLYSTSLPVSGVNNNIVVINTKANPVTTSTIHVGSTASSNPGPIALNPVNGKVYTLNYKDQSISVIDPSHNNSVITIPISTPYPEQIAFDSSTGEVYVTASGNFTCTNCPGGLIVIDPTTNSVTATVQTDQGVGALAVDPSTHNVYVANYGKSIVDVISPSSGYTITNRISTGPYTGPMAIVLDSSGKVYVASQNTHSTPMNPIPGYVEVINPTQGYSVTSITVGVNPMYITFDSGVNLIAVANQMSNTVSYISPSSLTVTATVAVGNMPNATITNGSFKGSAVANGGGTVSLITD